METQTVQRELLRVRLLALADEAFTLDLPTAGKKIMDAVELIRQRTVVDELEAL
jgi:hypothetical protein